jgi:hypothetical protein
MGRLAKLRKVVEEEIGPDLKALSSSVDRFEWSMRSGFDSMQREMTTGFDQMDRKLAAEEGLSSLRHQVLLAKLDANSSTLDLERRIALLERRYASGDKTAS